MKCLLTGGAGFLGRMLAAGLRESGFDVRVADLRALPGFPLIPVDLTRPETLRWPEGPFDVLVHAAGLAHVVPATEADGRRFFEVNAGGTQHLLDSLAGPLRPSRAVLISTVAVYGREEGELLDEETPLEARDPYGASRIEAESIFRRWAGREGVPWTILRLPLVWGEDPPGNLGAMIAAMREGRYWGVGRGDARRSLVWGMDVGRAAPAAARVGGVFHMTDGCHPTFREIEEAMAERLGLSPVPRMPRAAAFALAAAGSLGGRLLGRRLPFDLGRYRKMTRALTFSDARARAAFAWSPQAVLPLMRGGARAF